MDLCYTGGQRNKPELNEGGFRNGSIGTRSQRSIRNRQTVLPDPTGALAGVRSMGGAGRNGQQSPQPHQITAKACPVSSGQCQESSKSMGSLRPGGQGASNVGETGKRLS